MSRIYDASQRADLAQRAVQDPDATDMVEPFAAPGAEKLPARTSGILENIALYPWNPSIVSLPTLADRSDSIEQFRGLRSQIHQLGDQSPLKTILVSSGLPGEGKTFVAANLAMSLARNENNRILLIDGDLRGPTLHTILGAPNVPGLTEYLAGAADVSDILQRNRNSSIVNAGQVRSIPNLTFIPAGAGGDSSSELVANHRIEELLAALAPHFDWILVDSPPVLAYADAIDLARAADGVLLIARGASTPFDVAQRAQIAFSSSRILGFVLNAVKDAPCSSNYYYGKQEAGSGLHFQKDKRRQG